MRRDEKDSYIFAYIYTCAIDYFKLLFHYVHGVSELDFLYFDECKFCTVAFVA